MKNNDADSNYLKCLICSRMIVHLKLPNICDNTFIFFPFSLHLHLYFMYQHSAVTHSVGPTCVAILASYYIFCTKSSTGNIVHTALYSRPGKNWRYQYFIMVYIGIFLIMIFLFQSSSTWLTPILQDMLRHIFQFCILESNQEILDLIHKVSV